MSRLILFHVTVTLMVSALSLDYPVSANDEKPLLMSCDGNDLVSRAIPIDREIPMMPNRAINRNVDGWVKLEFVILSSGRTSDIRVIDTYPEGMFERSAIRAVEKWVYAEQEADRLQETALSFEADQNRGLRRSISKLISSARDIVYSSENLDQALELLDKAFAKKSLSLSEIMVIEQTRGLVFFVKRDFEEAARHFELAQIVQSDRNNHFTDITAESLIIARVNSGQHCRAVHAFDSWVPFGGDAAKEKIAPTIAKIRSDLEGRRLQSNR